MTKNPNTPCLQLQNTCLLLTAVMAFTLVGCGIGGSANVSKATSHLRILASQYSAATRARNKPPADEAEFKKFVNERVDGAGLERYDIQSPEELFISKRDGKPFVVFYGKKPKGVDPEVVAYEQEGIDGKRWVAFSLGNIEEVDETRFRELVPASAAP